MRIPLADMARRATNRRRRLVMRPIEPTSAQAQALAGLYIAVLRVWQEGLRDQVLPAYSRTLAEQRGLMRDSVAAVEVAIDQTEARAIDATVRFRGEVENWAGGVERWHMRKFIAQIKYATTVDLSTMIGPADARLTIEQSVARNAGLVRNVSDQVRGKVADIVLRGLQSNTPVREVAKEIALATGLARDRALRIASDQTVKLSAALDRERQQQMGMTSFEWRHSGKAHPREYHQVRNKKVFEWDGEVGKNDPPGYAPFCGCKALGVLDLSGAPANDIVARPALPRSMVRPPRRLLPPVARPVAVPDPVPAPAPAARSQDAEMRDFVADKGRAENVEYLAAYEQGSGQEIARYSSGQAKHVSFSPEFLAAIQKPTNRVIAHHNHPSSSSFSQADLDAVNYYPGLKGLYAHGHDGTSYYTELVRQYDSRKLIAEISEEFRSDFQSLYWAKELSFEAITKSHSHYVSVALKELGFITYETSTVSPENRAAWDEAEPFAAKVITRIKRRLARRATRSR